MSSSLIYRAFGFRAYQVVQTSTHDGTLALSLRQDQRHDRCSHCQSANVIRHGAEERTFRTVPIGGKPVELHLPVPRLGCRDCGLVRQAAVGFAAPYRRFTGCGRDRDCSRPPAQIRTCGIPASGSYFG